MQPGSQVYETINWYLLAIICGTLCVNKLKKNLLVVEKHPQNVIAMHAEKGLYTSRMGKHGG